jgi:hypothetical protein
MEKSRLEILNSISLSTDWVPDEEFYKRAVVSAVSAETDSYYTTRPKFITGPSIRYLWESMPSRRDRLLNTITCADHKEFSGYTAEMRCSIIDDIYNAIQVDMEIESNRLRAELSTHIIDFDYLSEITKHGLTGDDSRSYRIWESVGSATSKDPNFFNYLWNRVAREKGAVSVRNAIISNAFNKSAISDEILTHVAKRGTKTMKRTLVSAFSSEVSRLRKPYGYWKKESDLEDFEILVIRLNEKRIAKIEQRLMLFADTDDRHVVQDLMGIFSKNNLPWLIPAASKHEYLSRKLNKLIEE